MGLDQKFIRVETRKTTRRGWKHRLDDGRGDPMKEKERMA